MIGSMVGLRSFLVAASFVLASAGCSTVIKTASGGEGKAGVAEREALREAAANVARTPWPKPSSSSLAERLTGVSAEGARVSRNDAIDAYLVSLKGSGAAEASLIADADRHLGAAGALKEVAEIACDSANPRLSDVALIEDAIADLRETRSIYAAAIKKLDGDTLDADQLKQSFDEVIREIGTVADLLAENAMKRSSESFAGPGSEEHATGAL